jgi:hypothetical protein
MLEIERFQPAVVRSTRSLQQRGATFSQSDDIFGVVEKGNELAVPPDTALIDFRVAAAAMKGMLLNLVL